MATVVVNKPAHIEFVNITTVATDDTAPRLTVQSGNWETTSTSRGEAGIVFDAYGAELPILTPTDARKLAKWLNRAADELDGGHKKNNKNKQRHYERDDDDNVY